MYEFIKNKYNKSSNIALEVLSLDDIVTEEEKQDFLIKISRLDIGSQDRALNEDLRQSIYYIYLERLDMMCNDIYEEIQLHLSKSNLSEHEMARLKELVCDELYFRNRSLIY